MGRGNQNETENKAKNRSFFSRLIGKVDSEDFIWSYTDEPHATRRKEILAKYGPEIRKLYGPCPQTKWICTACVIIQTYIASQITNAPIWLWFLITYAVGGTINHSISLALHEISHNLAFKKPIYNRLFGIFTNLCMGIPSSVTFQKYHRDHHSYQGEDTIDADIPTAWEGRTFNNTFMKLIWMFLQPLFYAFRPLLTAPKPPTIWEFYNWAAQVTYDYAIFYFFGWKALLYLVCGTLLGLGLHPIAGHFIAEHYVFYKEQETYSYYGPLNKITWNVGYHNEHHDFPWIAGSRLPQVRRIAPEFYNDLKSYSSWTKVIWDYVTDSTVGPFSRIKRKVLAPEKRARLLNNSLDADAELKKEQ